MSFVIAIVKFARPSSILNSGHKKIPRVDRSFSTIRLYPAALAVAVARRDPVGGSVVPCEGGWQGHARY